MNKTQPLLKWAGGKRKLAPLISKIVNDELPDTKNYVEPFFGGGAVYFELYNNNQIKSAEINDIVPQLVNFYKTISTSQNIEGMHSLIVNKLSYFNSLKDLQKRKKYFEYLRGSFNYLWSDENRYTKKHLDCPDYLSTEDSYKSSVLLYVLNRTCFNGLFRVNSKGLFNVPLGSYEKVQVPKLSDFVDTSKALSKSNVYFGDYENVLKKALLKRDTFIYLDPPYVANSKTSDFTSYSKSKFKDGSVEDSEHLRLAKNFDFMVNSGAKILLSNHNNQRALSIFVEDKKNIFVYEVDVTKTIGRVQGSKNASSELLISSFKISSLEDRQIR